MVILNFIHKKFNRYYSKYELPDRISIDIDMDCISNSELFESNHEDVI